MIAFEALNEMVKTPKANLLHDTKESKRVISFETLLKNINKNGALKLPNGNFILPKEDTKTPKRGQSHNHATNPHTQAIIFSQEEQTGLEVLQSLLTNSDAKLQDSMQTSALNDTKNGNLILNPNISQTLSTQELKMLINKAKKYLKDKIASHPEFQKLRIKKLPNSLKSLATIAQKLQIDLSKLTYETIEPQSNQHKIIELTKEKTSKLLQTNKQQSIAQNSMAISKTITQTKTTHIDQESNKKVQTLTTQIKRLEPLQSEPILVTKKSTITTTQIIQTKKNLELSHTKSNQKERANITPLSQLLNQKESIQQLSTPIQKKAAISQVTASILESRSGGEKEKSTQKSSLEKLLKSEHQLSPKEPFPMTKSDFEVKIQESKQMLKYLSQNIKQAIEDYKPPFSRIKVQLNPQKLGEIDLTVVQRGKNVHINLSSNNTALNILTHNVAELKTQLQQNGIQNASFYFNSQSQSDSQQRQQQQRASKAYELYEDEEIQSVDSLEIIIPRYI